jgi:hypothetical protein
MMLHIRRHHHYCYDWNATAADLPLHFVNSGHWTGETWPDEAVIVVVGVGVVVERFWQQQRPVVESLVHGWYGVDNDQDRHRPRESWNPRTTMSGGSAAAMLAADTKKNEDPDDEEDDDSWYVVLAAAAVGFVVVDVVVDTIVEMTKDRT